ncbi:MAG: hypothetical protein AAF442_07230 [Pseudomonadota bacterium]
MAATKSSAKPTLRPLQWRDFDEDRGLDEPERYDDVLARESGPIQLDEPETDASADTLADDLTASPDDGLLADRLNQDTTVSEEANGPGATSEITTHPEATAQAPPAPSAPVPATYSEDDLTRAREEAHKQGYNEGHTKALSDAQEAEKVQRDTLAASVLDSLAKLKQAQEETLAKTSKDVLRLVATICSQMGRDDIKAQHHALSEILPRTLAQLVPQTPVNIYVPAAHKAFVEELCQNAPLALEIKAKPACDAQESSQEPLARIEWPDGNAVISLAALHKDMTTLIGTLLGKGDLDINALTLADKPQKKSAKKIKPKQTASKDAIPQDAAQETDAPEAAMQETVSPETP